MSYPNTDKKSETVLVIGLKNDNYKNRTKGELGNIVLSIPKKLHDKMVRDLSDAILGVILEAGE